MYTLTQYNKAHTAACERIGLKVSKALGTTPHGHRHAYGRRLRKAGVDKALVRRFMHHASMESQEVYTQASTREAVTALKAAAQRLRDLYPTPRSASDLLLPGADYND
jgi:integrase